MDLAKELGAQEGFSTQRLSLYVPNKDRVGNEFPDYETWVAEARQILTRIGGGSTALPLADGTWDAGAGVTIWEKTRHIYCFILPEQFEANLRELRAFLHRFGRETNQGEVVLEFDGHFFRIKQFDEAGE